VNVEASVATCWRGDNSWMPRPTKTARLLTKAESQTGPILTEGFPYCRPVHAAVD
jgi:hypothetical protein